MRVEVARARGRARCLLTTGHLSPRVLGGDADGVRVGVVATGALLLGGDHVMVDLHVGPGAWLEIVEPAGTVAYDSGGREATWTVTGHLGEGARLVWDAQPLVVADGADVTRSTELHLGRGARALLRETLILGRTGERGGPLRTRTRATIGGRPLLAEDLDVDGSTRVPGIVGDARVIDTVLALGWRPEAAPDRLDLEGPGALSRQLAVASHAVADPAWAAWEAELRSEAPAALTN